MSVSPILQIHDELLFCVENGAVTDWYKRVKKTMESVVEWKVPVVAEGKAGPSWGEQQKLGDTGDRTRPQPRRSNDGDW